MAELLKAALDPIVLALIKQRPDHGYGLLQRLKDEHGIDVSDGSLYPALYRLEKDQLIQGEWQQSERGRKRKVFHLTTRGRKQLDRHRERWPAFAATLSRLLGPANA